MQLTRGNAIHLLGFTGKDAATDELIGITYLGFPITCHGSVKGMREMVNKVEEGYRLTRESQNNRKAGPSPSVCLPGASGCNSLQGTPIGGTVFGAISSGNATVQISPGSYANASEFQQVQYNYLETALHESIHLAGSAEAFSDQALADAAFDLAMADKSLSEKQIKQYEEIDGDVTNASNFWNSLLRKHCK